MLVGDICTREVVSIDASSSLREAAVLMRERHVGALLVTDNSETSPEGPRALGIVTDRDLAIEAMARGLPGDQVALRQLAQGKLATVPATARVSDAIATMRSHGVRRLLVATPAGELYGIVTLEDLIDAMAHEMHELASALRAGLQREVEERHPIVPPVQAVPAVRGLPV